MRHSSGHQVIARCIIAGLLLIGLMVAPSGGSPAGASSLAVTGAPAAVAPAADKAGIAIPNDVAVLIAQGAADIIVGIDPAPGVTAAQRSATRPAAADRQAGADRAAAVYAGQKNSALASAGPGVRTVRALDALPVEVVRVDTPAALAGLAAAPGVTSLSVPAAHRTAVDTDLALIHQPQAQQAGYTGAGVVVAVLDTGVDYRRAPSGTFGNCSQGPGTGTCRIDHLVDVTQTGILDFDGHGTNVSGVVAKTAPEAHLDVYGVFHTNGVALDTDLLAALNAVAQTGAARNVRAVNLSLGDESFHTTECTASPYSAAFSSLRAVGILPVVAAGNSAVDGADFDPGVASPACATGAIRVGAVYPQDFASDFFWAGCADAGPRADQIACFSQGGPLVSLLAPGVDITAAGITESGTSQATPHVAGAVADLATANPSATAGQIAQALTSTGPSVIDTRDNRSVRRLDIAAAADAVQCLSPVGAGRALAGCPATGPGMFTPLTPSRLLDTRSGTGAAGPVLPLGTLTVQIAGKGGIPATGTSAVALNVTAVGPTGDGYITAWPSGRPRPDASNLNFYAGQNIPNMVIVPISADGKINLFNGSWGTVELLADVAGYYLAGEPNAFGAFKSLLPSRVLDTRNATGAALGPVPALGTIPVQISGAGGVPAGASAVALNVTAVGPTGDGYITAWPSGKPRPDTSNLNFYAGRNIPNMVIIPISADGKINLFNGSSGTVHLLADVAGYFLGGGTPTVHGAFHSLTPNRLLDTRSSVGAAGPLPALDTLTVQITGRGGVPVTGVTAVTLNVTAVGPTVPGFVTVWPSGKARPEASNLNFSAGQNIPNTVIVPIGVGGKIKLFNGSGGTVYLLADVSGYYLAG